MNYDSLDVCARYLWWTRSVPPRFCLRAFVQQREFVAMNKDLVGWVMAEETERSSMLHLLAGLIASDFATRLFFSPSSNPIGLVPFTFSLRGAWCFCLGTWSRVLRPEIPCQN